VTIASTSAFVSHEIASRAGRDGPDRVWGIGPSLLARGDTIANVRTLVTGASGFLGHAVCTELRAREHEVLALVRRPGSEPEGTHAVAGDMRDGDGLRSVVEEVRPASVFHLAAEIATQRDPRKIEEVNIEGTRRLLGACEATGAPMFVFVSTVVTGEADGAVLDETSPLPVQTAYGRSKQEGEQLVRDSALPSIILRPSHVYGPGGWYEHEIVKRLKQPGRLVVIGSGDNWWDVVRVEDVASACVAAAERAHSGALYHVVDDEPIRYYEFAELTAEALGVGKPRRVPAALARLVTGRDPVAAVVRSARSSNALIKRELGWQPRWPSAREGVPDAVAKLTA
jgi:nucleoside-diphosphate-sugar epimerase